MDDGAVALIGVLGVVVGAAIGAAASMVTAWQQGRRELAAHRRRKKEDAYELAVDLCSEALRVLGAWAFQVANPPAVGASEAEQVAFRFDLVAWDALTSRAQIADARIAMYGSSRILECFRELVYPTLPSPRLSQDGRIDYRADEWAQLVEGYGPRIRRLIELVRGDLGSDTA